MSVSSKVIDQEINLGPKNGNNVLDSDGRGVSLLVKMLQECTYTSVEAEQLWIEYQNHSSMSSL